jgi:hypothetical protein
VKSASDRDDRPEAVFVSGGAALVELPPGAADGTVYVVTKTAAALIGVAPCTITRWRDLGYLTPVAGSPPRKPLYRWPDVVEAEYQARQAAIAASGTDRQVRRSRAA